MLAGYALLVSRELLRELVLLCPAVAVLSASTTGATQVVQLALCGAGIPHVTVVER